MNIKQILLFAILLQGVFASDRHVKGLPNAVLYVSIFYLGLFIFAVIATIVGIIIFIALFAPSANFIKLALWGEAEPRVTVQLIIIA